MHIILYVIVTAYENNNNIPPFSPTHYNYRLNSPITLEELEVGCMTELGMMGPKQCQSHLISRQCCLSKMGIAIEYTTSRLELFNGNSSVFQISPRFPYSYSSVCTLRF